MMFRKGNHFQHVQLLVAAFAALQPLVPTLGDGGNYRGRNTDRFFSIHKHRARRKQQRQQRRITRRRMR